jgi:tape measure domain-containing protein
VILASGGSIDDVSGIIDALSSRFVTFGLSADKSKRVMNGVIQAFGKGKLMAEELTQQISEADPAFKTDLANAIGVTVAELGEMVKAGELTSNVLLEVLPLLAKNSVYFSNLGNSATSAVAALGRGQATIEQVKNQLATLTQLNTEGFAVLFRPLLGAFLQIQAATVDFITQLRQLESIRTVISFINALAQQLSGLYTIFLNVTVVLLKFVEPIFAVIRALDQLKVPFTDIGIASATLAGLITGKLVLSLFGLAKTAIPAALTSLGNLGRAFAASAVAAAGNFVSSIGGAITSLASYATKTAVAVIGNDTLTASYARVTAAIAAKTAAEAAESGGDAVQLALDLGEANGKLAKSTAAAAETAFSLKDAIGVTGPQMAVVAAVVASAALIYDNYKQQTQLASDTTSKLNDQLKQLNVEFSAIGQSALGAVADTQQFYDELERLSKITRQRNAFEIVIDYIFSSDVDSAISTFNVTRDLTKQFKELNKETALLKTSIQGYSQANDASGASGEKLVISINKQIKAYDALIQNAIEARAKALQAAKSTGGGISKDEERQLKGLMRQIEKFRTERDNLIKESQSKGLEITAKISTQGGAEASSTIATLQEDLKGLQEKQATLRFGTSGYEETQAQIRGLQGFIQYLESNQVTINIKAQFDLDKAALEGSLNVASALFENVKARANLEQSVYGIIQSRDKYAIESEQNQQKEIEKRLEKEIEVLKERKAGQELIDAKEKELTKVREDGENRVEALREQARANEIKAAQARYTALDAQFAAERKVLDLKQSQQRTEADMAILTAKNVLLEAQKAEAIAMQNKAKAEQTWWTQEDDKAAASLLDNARQYVSNAEKGVEAARSLRDSLAEVQAIERDSLRLTQEATRNSEKAKLEALGIGQSIQQNSGYQSSFNQGLRDGVGYASGISNGLAGVGSAASSSTGDIGRMGAAIEGAAGSTGRLINSAKVMVDEAGNLYTALSQDPTDPLARGLSEVAGELYNIERGSADAKNELVDLSNGFVSASGNLALIPGGFIAAGRQGLAEWENAVRRTAGLVGNVAAEIPLKAVYGPETNESFQTVRAQIQQTGTTNPIQLQAELQMSNQGMAESYVASIVGSYERYGYAVNSVKQATDQLSIAQQQYNQAVTSGDPGAILTAAGYVSQTKDALDAANFELGLASEGFEDASNSAAQLGINMSQVPSQIYGISDSTREAMEQADGLTRSFYGTTPAIDQVRSAIDPVADDINDVSGTVSGLNSEIAATTGEFSYADGAAQGLLNTTGALVEDLSSDQAGVFAEYLGDASSNAEDITGSGFDQAAVDASSAGSDFSGSLQSAAGQAEDIFNTLSNIDGLNPTVTVNVVGTPGRFAGGPVDPGQMYRVNELGKEAFLSASGRLSMINKPRNGMWRAPSRGTVIPAHLTSQLDIPSGGVNLASGASARVSRAASGVSGAANLSRAMAAALKASGLLENNNNVAVSQAGQAAQLGKLTHAVNKLVDKDWNVHVNVKNPSSASYLNFINRMS